MSESKDSGKTHNPTVPTTFTSSEHPKNMKSKYKVPFSLLVIGCILILIGANLGAFWTLLFNKILLHNLILTETSKSFTLWKETPIPMYLKIYLFNWTNPNEFRYNNTKPNFVEMGPYVFREVDRKIPLKWNENDTLTFHQKRTWHFEPKMTNGSLDDFVTNLNPVAATVVNIFGSKSRLIKAVINNFMLAMNETFVVRKTVRELLFLGYEEQLLKIAKKMKLNLPYEKFGWFSNRNNSETYDGTFNMIRGEHNIHQLAMVKQWNYETNTKYYDAPCNQVQGSIGDLWPPLFDNNKTVSIFASDICTSLTLAFDDTTDHLGLSGYRYISDENMLDNGTKIPSRKCYCQNGKCQPSGTLNISKCKFNAPVFLSLPHFYLADKSYIQNINGMNPNKTKHQFYIDIEPKTGIPLQVRAKLQINLLIKPYKEFALFSNITETYVPMIWFTQEATLTTEFAEKVKFIMILPMLGHVTFFGLCGIGFVLLLASISLFYRTKRNNDDRQILLKD